MITILGNNNTQNLYLRNTEKIPQIQLYHSYNIRCDYIYVIYNTARGNWQSLKKSSAQLKFVTR